MLDQPHNRQSLKNVWVVSPLAADARGTWQETNFFIVTKGRCTQAGSASNLADTQIRHENLLDLNLTSSGSVDAVETERERRSNGRLLVNHIGLKAFIVIASICLAFPASPSCGQSPHTPPHP